MLARSTRIDSNATALALILAVQVEIKRAEAHRLRAEAEDGRARTAALDRRAESLEEQAADAERKLQELLASTNTASAAESTDVAQLVPFALSPRDTAHIENCGVTLVYDRIRRGEYQTIRDGSRTKITMESIKARRAKLQAAEIKPLVPASEERRRRRAAAKELQAAEIKPLPVDTRSRRSKSEVLLK